MNVVIVVSRLVAQDTGLAPVAPLLKTYAKVETLSIAELNDFVITAPSQVCNPHYISSISNVYYHGHNLTSNYAGY